MSQIKGQDAVDNRFTRVGLKSDFSQECLKAGIEVAAETTVELARANLRFGKFVPGPCAKKNESEIIEAMFSNRIDDIQTSSSPWTFGCDQAIKHDCSMMEMKCLTRKSNKK